ncbi:uncharacterized protein LOC18013951 [Eutrema salsugineum]|uniref:uncharacterized protein LOC18013951 n=1 Tax=Eutrema salsugineum TaxID=72664 RepID=UPI000CED5D6B|nr:uncharacterized protein LOC18013951 [Eutrema salsugineum]
MKLVHTTRTNTTFGEVRISPIGEELSLLFRGMTYIGISVEIFLLSKGSSFISCFVDICENVAREIGNHISLQHPNIIQFKEENFLMKSALPADTMKLSKNVVLLPAGSHAYVLYLWEDI